jgi:uncharacterized protein
VVSKRPKTRQHNVSQCDNQLLMNTNFDSMPSLRDCRSTLRIHCALSRKTLLFVFGAIFFLQSITCCSCCQTCFWPRLVRTSASGSPPHRHHESLTFVGTTVSGTYSRATSVAVAVVRQQPFSATYARTLLLEKLSTFKELVLSPKSITGTRSKVLIVSIAAAVVVGGMATMQRCRSRDSPFQRSGIRMRSDPQDKELEKAKDGKDTTTKEASNLSAAMIGAIGFYKNFISPLLPPACRFVPTCSQYGVQAITEFGPTRGAILTSWRLLRCSPFGGKGYDPPRWPPVKYTYSSY